MSEFRLDATIPTVEYGNLHVQANNPSEMLELLQDEALHAVLDELRLIDGENNVKRAGLAGGNADADRDPWADTEPPRGDAPSEATQGGSWQQSKQRSNARDGSSNQPPTCSHGKAMKFKSGNGRTGPWKAWFCQGTRDRDQQCDPVWLDD